MSYEIMPTGEKWHDFYHFLDDRLVLRLHPECNGKSHFIVTTPGGESFLAYGWIWVKCLDNPDNIVYLEIHPERGGTLEFRVWVRWTTDRYERADVRDDCSDTLNEIATHMRRHEIIAPPPNPRPGQWMRFGLVEPRDWLLGKDKKQIVETLHVYERILEECAAEC